MVVLVEWKNAQAQSLSFKDKCTGYLLLTSYGRGWMVHCGTLLISAKMEA